MSVLSLGDVQISRKARNDLSRDLDAHSMTDRSSPPL